MNEDTLARAMAGEDVQLSYAVEWIWTQAESTTAEPATAPGEKAAAGWVMPLVALAGLAVWFGRR
jgi:carboxyl-terminal processing protease